MKYKKKLLTFAVLAAGLILMHCGGDDNPNDSVNNPPDAPYSPTPADGAADVSVNTDLSWRGSDPDANDVLKYNVYFDDLDAPAAENYDDSTFALGTLDPNTDYSWKIIAYDFAGDSTEGPVWGFTTGDLSNQPPGQPYNPSPADGSTDEPVILGLSWSCVDPDTDDTLSYDIYFDTTIYPALIDSDLAEAVYNPGTLLPNTTYYWKVVAFDNQGDSTIGQLWYFTTGAPAEGIFAALVVGRSLTFIEDILFPMDILEARFDSVYAPCNPVNPLEADGVSCNSYILDWDAELGLHRYTDPLFQPFIELAETYVFTIEGSPSIPSLVDSIDFPATQTYVTDPVYLDTVSLSGFDVTWSGAGSGSVLFIIMSGEDSTGVSIMTPNDGSYSFTNGDLSPLNNHAGEYGLMLIYQNNHMIDAPGYDSRSFIWGRIINTTLIYLE